MKKKENDMQKFSFAFSTLVAIIIITLMNKKFLWFPTAGIIFSQQMIYQYFSYREDKSWLSLASAICSLIIVLCVFYELIIR